ncbi:hypothetical protein HHK36_028009 [Tetracentron sinense]|uniref:DUF4371 domain-containing protein n=1 Tax=Tetracentron sinense TaxID=13715 RepID=A0A834YIH0_TETSI|nr:hypothetical protein HHK36_028009 [Tetracentron sinense]
MASYNETVAEVVLENAPGNAKYTSPMIQNEILHIFSSKVQSEFREEIGDTKFCIIVDEAWDEYKREQMALVLRFVDKDGFLRERFFDIVHVSDTMALTLKKSICAVLSHHNLSIQNIRGQGYDRASNMRDEWNGLQTFFLKDCPFTYYIHCFAHRLQLTLVAASKEVKNVYHFFSKLTTIVTIVGTSCKRNDELQVVQAEKITHLLVIDELESGRGLNQIDTLQQPGDTRWGSHFNSVCSLIKMFDATCAVLQNIDSQLQELNRRFNEHTMELFVLSSALDPRDSYKSFKIEDICNLAGKFYPQDFTEQENIHLRYQLQHYERDVPQHPKLRNMLTISELCQGLVKKGKSAIYLPVDRLIRLELTLPVSTATTERAFSSMKIIKTRLATRWRMNILQILWL